MRHASDALHIVRFIKCHLKQFCGDLLMKSYFLTLHYILTLPKFFLERSPWALIKKSTKRHLINKLMLNIEYVFAEIDLLMLNWP